MKILLDECLPLRLRTRFSEHDVFTVDYCGWKGIRNGDLLRLANEAGFQAVITTDLGMEHSQSRAGLPISVILLHAESNDLNDLDLLVPGINVALSNLAGATKFVHVSA